MNTIKVKIRDIRQAPTIEVEIPTECPECHALFTDHFDSNLLEYGWSAEQWPSWITEDGSIETNGSDTTDYQSMITGYMCGRCHHTLCNGDE